MKDEFYYKKDRIGQLRGFCAMVQNDCSVTKAAEKLGLERPAVSRQITALERDLDVSIFDRSNSRKLVLTEDGQTFYNIVMPALQQIDGMFQNFKKELEIKKKSIIKIAAFNIILKKMLPFIVSFKERNPNVDFVLINIDKENAFKRLIDNELDVVIYPTDENEECPIELEREKISINTSYLALYPEHPLSNKNEKTIKKEDIAKYNLLSSGFLYSKNFTEFIKNYNVTINTNISHVNIDFVKEMVRNKMGIAFIDDFWFDEKEKKDFILKKDYIFPPMYFYSFYRRNTQPRKIVCDFLKIIKKNHNKIFH
jgi:LysR family transcriptional regulator, cys regulon transcriptional activator